jgi:hypothetical protein
MPPPIAYTTSSITKQWQQAVTATVVTKATAILNSTNMTGGSGPSADIQPPGWGDGTCPTHHNRGHLIGNDLGGPGNAANNLVTLTAGTNHPFMYEFEDAVRRYVIAHAGNNFTYTVECEYDGYQATTGFPIPGAGGNPFCLFPAPNALRLSLQGGGPIMLGDLVKHLPTPPTNLGAAAFYTSLYVPNGGYKLYSSASHIANTCWATSQDPHSLIIQANAAAYARKLGHIP